LATTPRANVAAELLAKQVFNIGLVIDHENIGAQILSPLDLAMQA
jgi:hypothetical protein